ncbi:amino acid ABC transporter substrate-binding protein [Paenibacillus sp. SEL1]|jgi:polar amino acid transport system substrate-binding protein|uniref:Amino acid ABC transporter substrate-binding protein n=1 Tax=Paenibacillus polymyxa TaxID=1406 RepID=A0AAE9IAC8_PAEPO|nr:MULTISPECIES: amino acid ABC transporter substrate-binding protein [Paenibacillus]KYG93007.1 amino acid ABC transporter substrate-binding protein [Paenibacillus polymyxa]MCP3796702.1 amino acid ABC transporter substrate-binding protein [Paenibacillus sp. CH40]MXO77516.1 transporter substrate-binding domain-containing protein [Paenibacillus sp. OT2-17]URJ48621.1 amino acid ABC transporter substrate-binding protein [Paenibacillus polymyxa]SFR25918.1 polar amino acid transport system substrate
MRKAAMFTMLIGLMMIVLAGCSGGKDDSKLIIGIDDKFAPMGFRDENNELTGFDIDYAKAAGEQMGKQVEFQPIDWSAKESELNSGRIDLIWNGYTITDERKEKVLFTKPYLKNSQVIVIPATSSLSKLADLTGKTVGLQTLSSAADALDANPIKSKLKQVSEFPDNVLALTDLKTGRLDAVVIDEVVAKYYMSKEQGTYKLLDESLAPEEYGIGVKKGNEELLTQLQSALDELHKNGKAAEISKKWFGEDKVLN